LKWRTLETLSCNQQMEKLQPTKLKKRANKLLKSLQKLKIRWKMSNCLSRKKWKKKKNNR
jgi:hypothetical protein